MQMQEQVQEAVLTANDYYDLPEEFRERHELVNGYLVRRRKHMLPHQRQAFLVAVALHQYAEANGTGFATMEGDCLVTSKPDTIRIPDALFVPNSRLPRDGPLPDYLKGAPDLAVEVLSKGMSEREMRERVEQFLANGARTVWVARPQKRTVTIHRAGVPVRVLTEDDDLEDRDILPGFRYPVRRIFN
jgi:Uma2 family endonuclease